MKKYVASFYLMLLSPAFTLYIGLRDSSYKFKRWILTFFVTIYGSIITISESNDGYRHLENVYKHYVDLSFSQFLIDLVSILKFAPLEGINDDVYIHFLSFFVGSILGIPQLFFVFVSFVYGYFFSGSILKVLSFVPKERLSIFFYYFATIFVLTKNIEGVNTVRTWTGLWVLFYASINYFESRKIKYLILMFASPLIHVAYFIMALPALAIAFLGNRFKLIYAVIFIASLFYGLNQNIILNNLGKTQLGEDKIRGYYVEDIDSYNESKVNDKQTWYLQFQKLGVQQYPLLIIVFTLILGGSYFKGMTSLESKLFSVGILMKSLSNFTFFLIALSNRSSLIGTIFILAAFVLLLKRNYFKKDMKKFYLLHQILFCISAILSIPFIIFKIADLISYMSIFLIALPFIPWFFREFNFSIREILSFSL